jgi:hypothetical protein
MPTLLRCEGFIFFFYANEHEPMHIHVQKGEHFAKIELNTLRVVKKYMPPKELRRALEIAKEHNDAFVAKWREWFDQR